MRNSILPSSNEMGATRIQCKPYNSRETWGIDVFGIEFEHLSNKRGNPWAGIYILGDWQFILQVIWRKLFFLSVIKFFYAQ